MECTGIVNILPNVWLFVDWLLDNDEECFPSTTDNIDTLKELANGSNSNSIYITWQICFEAKCKTCSICLSSEVNSNNIGNEYCIGFSKFFFLPIQIFDFVHRYLFAEINQASWLINKVNKKVNKDKNRVNLLFMPFVRTPQVKW